MSAKKRSKGPKEEYRLYDGNVTLNFWPDRHWYAASVLRADGTFAPERPVPSATGVLKMIDNGRSGGLMQWAVNMALEAVDDEWQHPEDWARKEEILGGAKFAHKRFRNMAGDFGTAVHEWVEEHIKAQMRNEPGPDLPADTSPIRTGCEAYVNWEAKHDIKYLGCEQRIYSVDWNFAGTLDILAEVDGELTIADIKTSARVYKEAHMQLAAYKAAIEEEFDCKVKNRLVIHIPRASGRTTIYDLNEMAARGKADSATTDFATFVHARKIYETLKGL